MLKRLDWFAFIVIALCTFFIIALSPFHLSFDGYLGFSDTSWNAYWAMTENGQSLFMAIVIALLSYGVIKKYFYFIMIPYFAVKLIYELSCYSGIRIVSPDLWRDFWGLLCVLVPVAGLIYCRLSIKKNNVA